MKRDAAILKLTAMLEAKPEIIEAFNARNDGDDDEKQLATDLIAWQNWTVFTKKDLARLLKLVEAENFDSWDCPTCDDGTRVYCGDPEDWSDYQSVLNADYASYPGYDIGSDDKRCDSCRIWAKSGYMPDGFHLEHD